MKSMTGYGTGEAASQKMRLSVEMSSVNRKQIDIVVNLPRSLAELESKVKQRVSGTVSRGRVSVYVQLEALEASSSQLKVDESLAGEYFAAMNQLAKAWGRELAIQPSDLLRAPGVFSVEEGELEIGEIETLMDEALGKAIKQMHEMQENEGAALKADLLARLDALKVLTAKIREQAPLVKKHYHAQIHRRLKEAEIDLSLDDERLLREIGIFAERCDISEELTRLDSHFEQFERYFAGNEACGRALDFLCQEVNREFNTIGSKANDAGIAQNVVESKTELEKIREQVQNVQ